MYFGGILGAILEVFGMCVGGMWGRCSSIDVCVFGRSVLHIWEAFWSTCKIIQDIDNI